MELVDAKKVTKKSRGTVPLREKKFGNMNSSKKGQYISYMFLNLNGSLSKVQGHRYFLSIAVNT
jgi:hypothetical protein